MRLDFDAFDFHFAGKLRKRRSGLASGIWLTVGILHSDVSVDKCGSGTIDSIATLP